MEGYLTSEPSVCSVCHKALQKRFAVLLPCRHRCHVACLWDWTAEYKQEGLCKCPHEDCSDIFTAFQVCHISGDRLTALAHINFLDILKSHQFRRNSLRRWISLDNVAKEPDSPITSNSPLTRCASDELETPPPGQQMLVKRNLPSPPPAAESDDPGPYPHPPKPVTYLHVMPVLPMIPEYTYDRTIADSEEESINRGWTCTKQKCCDCKCSIL